MVSDDCSIVLCQLFHSQNWGYSGKEKAFIATQGPMINTVNDFWQMVWQEDSPVIVMITKLKEKNEKCVLYWPEKRGIYGKVEVLVINVNECDNYTVRNLVLKLMLDVEEDRLASAGRGPVVVHCSAGIGRTGCFIATSIGCRQLKEEGVVDALSIVCQLRVDRLCTGAAAPLSLTPMLLWSTVHPNWIESTHFNQTLGPPFSELDIEMFVLTGIYKKRKILPPREVSGPEPTRWNTYKAPQMVSSRSGTEGFQIVHVQKQQCLFTNKIVVLGLCDGTSQNQQWMWTEDGKLLHVKSALCLAISNSSGGPFQSVIFAHCSQAPRWTCHEKEGFLEVENASLFLKKQGFKVVVKKGRKYLHSWMKMDVNKEGKPVNESLCLKKAGLGAEVSVRTTRNTAPPQISTTFNALPYSPGHLIRNITEAFTRSTTGNSSQMQDPSLQMAGITSWDPWTTQPFSSTTEETGLGEPVRCNFTVTQSRVSSRSVSLQWRTLASPCNFSLNYSSDTSGVASCHPVRIDNATYGCNLKDLRAGTIYNLRIVSQDGEERTVVLQTDPLPPARFEVNKEKTTSTSLHVWWTPSSGKVSWYEVQLLDDKQKTQESQIQGRTSRNEYTFFNLTAGNKYNITITAVSGDKHSSTVYTNGSTVPSPVKDISISPKTDSLLISWSRGSGNVERYQLMLMDKRILVHSNAVDKYATSYTFHGLTPGHLYNVTIVTEAAGLQNYRWKPARTIPEAVGDLEANSSGSTRSLVVSWSPPAGDWEWYRILLLNDSLTLLNITVGKEETHYVIDDVGLIPGRQYEVEVTVVSGNLKNSKRCQGRTVPLAVLHLRVKHANETSLSVMWQSPAAEWEKYITSLGDRDLIFIHKSLPKDAKEFTFTNLVPGRKYIATVTSISGDLKNSSSTKGRT
ncbi:hypothetical protein CB1_001443025, partial [Camelus ferus]